MCVKMPLIKGSSKMSQIISEREFWVAIRCALLGICAAIEHKYLNVAIAIEPEVVYNNAVHLAGTGRELQEKTSERPNGGSL